jgi:hypothetical protein
MQLTEIDELPLHDATLVAVEMVWNEARCRVVMLMSSGRHVLDFNGVTMLRMSRELPWGPSVSINDATVRGGIVTIGMQSGDFITIAAKGMEYLAIE